MTVTEVMVELKRPPLTKLAPGKGNCLRLRLTPDLHIALGASIKKPGEAMVGEPTELALVQHDSDQHMSAHERLLGDAMVGDPTLFARQDAVEAAWAVVGESPHRRYRRLGAAKGLLMTISSGSARRENRAML